MCNGFGGCSWIIIIVLILLCCNGGSFCSNNNSNECSCGCNNCGC